ncbi:MAG: hypothetical protein MH472_12165 [Bacteroidia bacterium]|nr:hypothetical protein [Bacteroidia bacterium]
MNAVYSGDFSAANKLLSNDEKWEKQQRNVLLFYLNKGTILFMEGNHAASNQYFRKADYLIEDFNKTAGDFAVSFLVNAKFSTYGGENFEQILIHYFTTLNCLALNQHDEALVECKRMLEKMQRITDSYKSENKYKRDAFAHNLLGMIYDLKSEYNDAFIAYRNALEIYKEDYAKNYDTQIPEQLKRDILRTAKRIGFTEELAAYEKEFNMVAESINRDDAEILFFWNNGLGPIKEQNSFNILILPAGNGYVNLVNPELGISMAWKVDDKNEKQDLLDMNFIRLALPKYVSRLPKYNTAKIEIGEQSKTLYLAENINAIAYKSLQDRMGKELAIGLGRVIAKQLAVHQLKKNKDQQGFAAAAMIYSAVSEQADTRNWQLLPYAIHYTRAKVKPGTHEVKFIASNSEKEEKTAKYTVDLKSKQTKVLVSQTLDFTGYQQRAP